MKLGLQMYPHQAKINKLNIKSDNDNNKQLSKYSVGDEVEGTIVRLSQYGVYVNIGSEIDAYLHRRKMNIAKGQKSLKPWEITPLGSYIKGYIHTIDKERKRIGLTTYRPDQWENKLPSRSNYVDMGNDDDEFGGGSRADNLRALERELALELDGDDEDGDGDDNDDDGENGYKFTTAEIDALVAQRNAKLLIDEVGTNDNTNMATQGTTIIIIINITIIIIIMIIFTSYCYLYKLDVKKIATLKRTVRKLLSRKSSKSFGDLVTVIILLLTS